MLRDVTGKSYEDLKTEAGDGWVDEEIVINLPLRAEDRKKKFSACVLPRAPPGQKMDAQIIVKIISKIAVIPNILNT